MLTNAISEAIFESSGFGTAAVALIYAFLARKTSYWAYSEISLKEHSGDPESTISRRVDGFFRRVRIVNGTVMVASFTWAGKSRSFHAVKVYAVMPAPRHQVIGENSLLQDNQSIS